VDQQLDCESERLWAKVSTAIRQENQVCVFLGATKSFLFFVVASQKWATLVRESTAQSGIMRVKGLIYQSASWSR
jgi:hypothetical protein